MKKVVEIVGTNIPGLEAVDLSENRLHGLDGVVSLLQKAPNIKIIHLAKNKVNEMDISYYSDIWGTQLYINRYRGKLRQSQFMARFDHFCGPLTF